MLFPRPRWKTMTRREFIALVGSAAAGWPFRAHAQQTGKVSKVGILSPGPSDPPAASGFYEGLQALGYVEGQNIVIERRYGDWNSDRFHQLASELVRLK